MQPKKHFLILLFLFLTTSALATHLRCGYITVKQKAPGSTTVVVTVEVFMNTIHTNVLFGGEDDWLDFGDGSRMLVHEQDRVTRMDLQPDGSVAYTAFTVEHTYPTLASYTISYSEPNRNAAILNFETSVNTRFYLETNFLLMTDMAYQSPVPLLPPFFYGFADDNFSLSLAAADPNNFALRYSPRVPLMDKYTSVKNYRQSGSTFIDPLTGLINWDCKFQGATLLGEFLFGVQVDQFDTRTDPWTKVGHVYRDLQIIVTDNSEPKGIIEDNVTTEQNIVEIPESGTDSLKVFVYHDDGEEVTLTLSTELPVDYYTFTVYDSTHETRRIVVGKLELTHAPAIARNLPYIMSIRASFTTTENDRYFKDTNFAFITQEFIPSFGPISSTTTNEEKPFSLVPNPFKDFVWLKAAPDISSSLAVYNSLGQLVLTTQSDSEGKIDLSQLPPGMYFIKSTTRGVGLSGVRMMKE